MYQNECKYLRNAEGRSYYGFSFLGLVYDQSSLRFRGKAMSGCTLQREAFVESAACTTFMFPPTNTVPSRGRIYTGKRWLSVTVYLQHHSRRGRDVTPITCRWLRADGNGSFDLSFYQHGDAVTRRT